MSGELSRESAPAQLVLGGGEVDHATVCRSRAPLSSAQREIVLWLREHGSISATVAGVIVHSHRPSPCGRVAGSWDACCEHAATDGGAAMERVVSRGIARKVAVGLWVANGSVQ